MPVQRMITLESRSGMHDKAIEVLLDATRYANEHFHGVHELMAGIDGAMNRLYWLARYTSLAEFERSVQQRKEDNQWQKEFEKVTEVVDMSSVDSHFYNVLG